MEKIFYLPIIILIVGCASLKEFIAPEREIIQSHDYDIYQKILDQSINKYKFIGVQIALKDKNGVIWRGSSGTIDKERTCLLNDNHIIRIGSLSKPFLAIIILQLYESGKISLDDKICKWFPDFPQSDKISIYMLLNHSSGIKEFLGLSVFLPSSFNPNKIWTREEIYNLIKKQKLMFQPGEDHRYANSNYFLLAIIAEKLHNNELNTIIRDNILIPLQLEHTLFLPYDKTPANLINNYDRDLIPLPGWSIVKPDNTSWSSCAFGSGSMASTASDILTFYEALISNKLIKQETLDLMMEYHDSKSKDDKYLTRYGLGLFKFDSYNDYYGHQGLFIGSEALAIFNRDMNTIFVIIANVSTTKNKDILINEYLNMLQ